MKPLKFNCLLSFLLLLFIMTPKDRLAAQEYSFFSAQGPERFSENNKLYFVFENISFFKNNEYFNNLYDGITYIGDRAHPKIVYFADKSFFFSGGWELQYFSGREKAYISHPTLTASWLFLPGYQLNMGNLNGNLNHKLPIPLFSFDKYYTSPTETGVQILANRKLHETDIWLNWEKFILPGDNFKEEFTAGGRTELKIRNPLSGLGLSVALMGMAMHKGGQVESTTGHLQTVFNSAAGINVFYKLAGEKKDSLGIQSLFCGFSDASPYKGMLYSKGWGIHTTAYAKLSDWYFETGYWYGKHFIAPRGEWILQSVSQKYGLYWESAKNMFFIRGSWKHNISKGIKAGIGSGLFYDLDRNTTDFYYQLHILIDVDAPIRFLKTKY